MEPTTPARRSQFTRYDLGVTPFWTDASPDEQDAQRAWHAEIATRGEVHLGPDAFVSPLAAVYADRLVVGAQSYLAAHVYLWGEHEIGENCTLNPFSELRGRVRMGDGVRVGAHTSILGFNHLTSPDEPIHQQPLVYKGISIGDDVWIGSHVVVLDGVSIGAHSVIGAGSVVTKDVPAWTVAAGNPARPIRDRRATKPASGPADLGSSLHRLAETARAQAAELLQRCWQGDDPEPGFVDRPDADPTLRAWCDAVELSDMLLDSTPPQVGAERIIEVLRSGQDPRTGLVPELPGPDGPRSAAPSADGHAAVNYHVLAAGYALELLGSRFAHPITSVAEMSSQDLRSALDRLPWAGESWRAGSWVDAIGTALYRNRADFGLDGEIESLFGWLLTRCDRSTGLWGRPDERSRWLEPVNGFYRLTRGTFAQFGVPLPYPERTIDSVLAHAADTHWFRDDRGTACNVLDVIHPLWLSARQTGHRRAEGEQWARRQLARVLRSWRDGAGFSFALEAGHGPERTPGLLGTEMWLSITWLLADHLGCSDALGYTPRGVHRPEPRGAVAAGPL
jgi:acetyltransferase-like isoleucine patch superfamily enzyme